MFCSSLSRSLSLFLGQHSEPKHIEKPSSVAAAAAATTTASKTPAVVAPVAATPTTTPATVVPQTATPTPAVDVKGKFLALQFTSIENMFRF